MTRTTLFRRRAPTAVPFFPAPFFAPLAQLDEDFGTRASDLVRAAFGDFTEFPLAEKFPAMNVSESKNEFMITAELPGMTAKDVTVEFADGVLTIRGEKEGEKTKEEDDKKYFVWERRFGSFQRSFPFPGGIDEAKIGAEFKDGVLTVQLPKAVEEKTKKHNIAITAK